MVSCPNRRRTWAWDLRAHDLTWTRCIRPCSYFDRKEDVAAVVKTLPKIQSIVDNIGSLESVKSWMASRPQTSI